MFRGQEFDTHVGSQIAKQLEPPKKADAEFGYILSEVSHRHPVIHTIRVRSVALWWCETVARELGRR